MYIHVMASLDIKYNLAFEECLMRTWQSEEPLLLLWQSDSAVVLGKHQNAYEEINSKFIHDEKIPVVRRNSGGGTVYHDLGNLNYSIIASYDKLKQIDWYELYEPIVEALKKLGLPVEVSDRHDLKIEGRKISGTAQYRKGCNVLHHGTLLFNASIDKLEKSLEFHGLKKSSNAFQSVRSKVVNIYDHMKDCNSMSDFKLLLIDAISEDRNLKYWVYEPNYANEIKGLVEDKYDSWDWNYGRSKSYHVKYSSSIEGECISVNLMTKKCVIEKVEIEACESLNLGMFEQVLCGEKYDRQVVEKIVYASNLKLSDTFLNGFVDLIMGFY